jgi:hypothetical protein
MNASQKQIKISDLLKNTTRNRRTRICDRKNEWNILKGTEQKRECVLWDNHIVLSKDHVSISHGRCHPMRPSQHNREGDIEIRGRKWYSGELTDIPSTKLSLNPIFLKRLPLQTPRVT